MSFHRCLKGLLLPAFLIFPGVNAKTTVFSKALESNKNRETYSQDATTDDIYEEYEYFDDGSYYYPEHDTAMEMASIEVDPGILADDDVNVTVQAAMGLIGAKLEDRLRDLFSTTRTSECRAMITEHMALYINSIAVEVGLPYSEFELENTCPLPTYDFDNLPEGITFQDVMDVQYSSDKKTFIDTSNDLQLLYVILAHDKISQTIRLIDTLSRNDESNSFTNIPTFVVHIDAKSKSDSVWEDLIEYYADSENVHIVPNELRVPINWGGFNMVKATLQCLRYIFCVDPLFCPENGPIEFHKLIHLASTSYPIKSNAQIRETIAKFPLEANLMNVVMRPNNPSFDTWHYFIECDDALHRIYRLSSQLGEGVGLYTASQWFIISKGFAKYIAFGLDDKESFVHAWTKYASHTVVADEHYFGTILRNTDFCLTHHNNNYLFLQFDSWDNELEPEEKDPSLTKCLFPNPEHCGRSPSLLHREDLHVLELTSDLFARKFNDDELMDAVDEHLLFRRDDLFSTRRRSDIALDISKNEIVSDHGMIIVEKKSSAGSMPMCLGTGVSGNFVKLLPCFHPEVVPTLLDNWFTGAIIEEEIPIESNIIWSIGRCSTFGDLTFSEGKLTGLPDSFSTTGPRCQIRQKKGLRADRCLDADTHELLVYPCRIYWNQLFSFGIHFGENPVPHNGMISSALPKHLVRGEIIEQYYCVGTSDDDEGTSTEENDHGVMRYYPCSEKDQLLDFLFVPVTVEDDGFGKHSDHQVFAAGDEL